MSTTLNEKALQKSCELTEGQTGRQTDRQQWFHTTIRFTGFQKFENIDYILKYIQNMWFLAQIFFIYLNFGVLKIFFKNFWKILLIIIPIMVFSLHSKNKKVSASSSWEKCLTDGQIDTQTDGRTDGRTDAQTER